jgi:choline-sulfatase
VTFSEYHAVGAPSGSFMLGKGGWKLHEYVGFAAELFDLESDPEEIINRIHDPSCASVAADLRAEMRRIVDPEMADRQAKSDQQDLIEGFGGRDAAHWIGTEGATPAPTA